MNSLLVFSIALLVSSAVPETGLKDPRKRDDDISKTAVSVETKTLPSGFYEYVYTLNAPSDNAEDVLEFLVDISCGGIAHPFLFPEPPTTLPWDYWSKDKRHSPVQIYPSSTGSAWMGISKRNEVMFSVNMQPGESHTGFRILSPFPPVDRMFQLEPRWITGDYDYSDLTDEEWETLPGRDDFYINGMTHGPGCSPLPESPKWFPGTGEGPNEEVLQFAQPRRSAFHTTDSLFTVEVLYAADMVPETFRTTPASLRPLFTPVPGTREVVHIPLSMGLNKILLYAEARKHKPDGVLAVPPYDHDLFMIRRDAASPPVIKPAMSGGKGERQ